MRQLKIALYQLSKTHSQLMYFIQPTPNLSSKIYFCSFLITFPTNTELPYIYKLKILIAKCQTINKIKMGKCYFNHINANLFTPAPVTNKLKHLRSYICFVWYIHICIHCSSYSLPHPLAAPAVLTLYKPRLEVVSHHYVPAVLKLRLYVRKLKHWKLNLLKVRMYGLNEIP